MDTVPNALRRSAGPRLVLVAILAAAGLATLSASATAAGPRDGASRDDSPTRVVRVRRGGGGDSTVGVVRASRPAAQAAAADDAALALSSAGSITPDGGTTDVEIEDTDPIGAGLPGSTPGETGGGAGGAPGEEFMLIDIGVRGKRSGRTIMLTGAELAFVNCNIEVSSGTAIGYSGVMGVTGVNPGSAPSIQFQLESGGEITLTVQPAPSGSPSSPNRPVRTVTMQVP